MTRDRRPRKTKHRPAKSPATPRQSDEARAFAKAEWIKAGCVVVLGGIVSSLLEHTHANVLEVTYVLRSLVFAALGLITSHPVMLGFANAATALLLLAVHDQSTKPAVRIASRLIVQLNRSAGQLEALFTWLTLVIWWAPAFWTQIVGILTIVLIGPLAMTSLTYGVRGKILWWRLLVPAMLTLTGVTLVVIVAREQWQQLAPLVALVLAGLVPRTAWSLWKERTVHSDSSTDVTWTRFVDRLIAAAAVGVAIMVPLHALKPGHQASLQNRSNRTLAWQTCAPADTPAPGFALFIVSDNQFHALDGKRSGFHMEVVDRAVPVSVRPVELDLLSAVTFRAFADVYQDLRKRYPGLQWAHLGDSADVGCISEIDRFIALVPRFGLDNLAAVIPGNHDVAFLGNLAWHPDWTDACPGGRLGPEIARDKLRAIMPTRAGRFTSSNEGFLATVTTLGRVDDKAVVGVFLDTTDVPWDSVGIAGTQGGISDAQLDWVQSTLAHFPDGRVIIFGHHPIDQWTKRSRRKLERLAEGLGARLWGVVSAHTHLAAMREQELAGRTVPELIVGSTIDPPQEATLLEGSADGHLSIRTLPAVRRDGMTCSDDVAKTVSGERCREIFTKLRATKECAPLFSPNSALNASDPDCRARAKSSSVDESADSPDELDCLQEARANVLLSCLGAPGSDRTPLHDTSLPERVLAATDRDPDTGICLSWAASVLQAHKRDRWNFARAIEFCLEPSATYGELEASWPR